MYKRHNKLKAEWTDGKYRYIYIYTYRYARGNRINMSGFTIAYKGLSTVKNKIALRGSM